MRIPKYQLKAGQELLSFEFISEGPKGVTCKTNTIYGQIEENWYPFEKNRDYLAFLTKLKTS